MDKLKNKLLDIVSGNSDLIKENELLREENEKLKRCLVQFKSILSYIETTEE